MVSLYKADVQEIQVKNQFRIGESAEINLRSGKDKDWKQGLEFQLKCTKM